GRSRRAFWATTARVHHLLSDNETAAFQKFCWDDRTTDIREQYPILDRSKTEAICASLNVQHPRCRWTRVPLVVTTDFLITEVIDGAKSLSAYAVKEDEEVKRKRTQEKLAIEESYWTARGVPWKLLKSSSLKTIRSGNLSWILRPADEFSDSFKSII